MFEIEINTILFFVVVVLGAVVQTVTGLAMGLVTMSGITFLPTMAIALLLLTYLSEHHYNLLKFLLGLVIILAVMISPRPDAQKPSRTSLSAVGVLGGFIGGLCSAGDGPVAYFMYRQPIDLNVIRFSLFAVIGLSSLARTIMISVSGQMSREILLVSAISVPLVVIVTLWVCRYLHYIADKVVR